MYLTQDLFDIGVNCMIQNMILILDIITAPSELILCSESDILI